MPVFLVEKVVELITFPCMEQPVPQQSHPYEPHEYCGSSLILNIIWKPQ